MTQIPGPNQRPPVPSIYSPNNNTLTTESQQTAPVEITRERSPSDNIEQTEETINYVSNNSDKQDEFETVPLDSKTNETGRKETPKMPGFFARLWTRIHDSVSNSAIGLKFADFKMMLANLFRKEPPEAKREREDLDNRIKNFCKLNPDNDDASYNKNIKEFCEIATSDLLKYQVDILKSSSFFEQLLSQCNGMKGDFEQKRVPFSLVSIGETEQLLLEAMSRFDVSISELFNKLENALEPGMNGDDDDPILIENNERYFSGVVDNGNNEPKVTV